MLPLQALSGIICEADVKDYTIQFSGLADEVHRFDFVLEKSFFDHFIEDDVIKNGRVDVKLLFDKQPNMFVLQFAINGVVDVMCDRCTDPLTLQLRGDERLIVRIGREEESTDDDIVFIGEDDFEIDLTQHIYDYVSLLLPIRMLHDNSYDKKECNPEMIKLLKKYSVNNESI